jgi:hypothetical protein
MESQKELGLMPMFGRLGADACWRMTSMLEPSGWGSLVGPLGRAFLDSVIRERSVQAAGAKLCQKCSILAALFEGQFPVGARRRRGFREGPLQVDANVGHSEAKRYWRGQHGEALSNPIRPSIPTVDSPPTSFLWDYKWPVVLDGKELAEILSSEDRTNASFWRHPYKDLIKNATSVLADRHKMFFDLLRDGDVVAEGIRAETGRESALSRKEWVRPDRYLDVQKSDLFNKMGDGFHPIWESLTLRPPNRQVTEARSSKAPSPPASDGEEKTVASRKSGPKQTVRPRIEEAMRLDINEGRRTPKSLEAMLEKEMEAQYGASRDTCRKARRKVLSEFKCRQIATNDK